MISGGESCSVPVFLPGEEQSSTNVYPSHSHCSLPRLFSQDYSRLCTIKPTSSESPNTTTTTAGTPPRSRIAPYDTEFRVRSSTEVEFQKAVDSRAAIIDDEVESSESPTKGMYIFGTASFRNAGDDDGQQVVGEDRPALQREAKLAYLLESLSLNLDPSGNAVSLLPPCVVEILPLGPENELLSVGSLLHWSRKIGLVCRDGFSDSCRNCIFNSGRQGCQNGLKCVFCHYTHPKAKRRSRRRIQRADSATKLDQLSRIQQQPVASLMFEQIR